MSEIDNAEPNNFIKILSNLTPLIVLFLGWINRKKVIIWFKKQKLKIFPIDFNVAFSVDFKEGLNSGNYFEQIRNNLNNNIDELGLTKQIIIKDFSDIQKFKNKEEAETFRNKKKVDLIIWGSFTNDILKTGGQKINELNLKFTFGVPSDKSNAIGGMIVLDIGSKIAKKNYWKIVEDNSFEDIKIVSDNLFDISTYILAFTLKLSGRLDKSLGLFEGIYKNSLDKKTEFHKEIVPHLYNCYETLILENIINRKNFNFSKNLCLKMLNIDNNNFFAINNLAVSQCKLGNIKEAEILVEKLLQLYPKNPVTEVNVAYIRILQKNYTNSLKHYQNLAYLKEINFKPQEVIEFLGTEYDKTKEPAFLFGIGIVSIFWDKLLSKKSLKEFIKKGDDLKYKPMLDEAKKLLKM